MASASSKPVTKKDVEGVIIDASHTILTGVSLLLKNFARKDDLEKLATKDDLKREISFVRDDIKGLKGDLSNTPSRKQFEELKRKVDRYHPTLPQS